MNKFFLLMTAILLYSTISFSFWTDWHKKDDFCKAIKNTVEKDRCFKIWTDLEKKSGLPSKKSDFELCGKMFGRLEEMAKSDSSIWTQANTCLELIAYRRMTDIPKEQLKICDWLLEKSKSPSRYLFCLQEFDVEVSKICDYARDKGNFEYAGKCFQTFLGVKAESGTSKNFLKNCEQESRNDGRGMRVFTFPDWHKCVQNLAEKLPATDPDRSINFETGVLEATGR